MLPISNGNQKIGGKMDQAVGFEEERVTIEQEDSQDEYDRLLYTIEACGALKEFQTRSESFSNREDSIKIMKDILENMETPGLIQVKNLSKVLTDGITPIKWRVDKLIPERGVVFFGGTAGCYKTWLAMNVAISCATGKPFLNRFDVEKCKVLYVDEENGDITLPNRFEMLKAGLELKNEDLTNIDLSIFQNIKLDTIDTTVALDQLITENGYKVVVIDSMVRCMEGVENDSTDVRNVFNNLKNTIHKHKDVAFIILHHTIKGGRGMDSLRGSGDFAASADCVLMFTTAHQGFVNAEIVKNRHIDMSEFNKFSIRIDNKDNGGLVFTYGENDGFKDGITQCAECIENWFKGVDNGMPLLHFKTKMCKDEMQRYGFRHTMVHDALNYLLKEGKIAKHKLGMYDVEQTTLTDEDR